MPNVTALPKSGSDGKIQREFFDTVGTTSVTYTYSTAQNGIDVKNLGAANLTLTINGETKTIQPKKTESYEGSFTSFAIVSASGMVPFFADAYKLDSNNIEVRIAALEAGGSGGVDEATLNAAVSSAVSTAVATKADASTVTALSTTVAAKADTTYVQNQIANIFGSSYIKIESMTLTSNSIQAFVLWDISSFSTSENLIYTMGFDISQTPYEVGTLTFLRYLSTNTNTSTTGDAFINGNSGLSTGLVAGHYGPVVSQTFTRTSGQVYFKMFLQLNFADSSAANVSLNNFKFTINGTTPTIISSASYSTDSSTSTVTHNISNGTTSDFVTKLNKIDTNFTPVKVSTAQQLVAALTDASTKATSTNWYNIYLADGTYDLLPYIDLASIIEVTATGYRGVEVPRFTRLIGSDYRGSTIVVRLNNATSTVPQQWTVSPLNMKNDAELHNLRIIGRNCRYAVHDDGGTVAFRRYVKNCEIIHEQNENTTTVFAQQDAWGMGTYAGCAAVFEDTVFKAYGYGFFCHDNVNYTTASGLEFRNCRFEGGDQRANDCVYLSGMGASALTTFDFKGCSFNKHILHQEATTTTSVAVTGFGNKQEASMGATSSDVTITLVTP